MTRGKAKAQRSQAETRRASPTSMNSVAQHPKVAKTQFSLALDVETLTDVCELAAAMDEWPEDVVGIAVSELKRKQMAQGGRHGRA